ncbi:Uncharacterised protein [Vibrio cholerae]|nr:Uncharacterised protein [Vibrio cholerae]
MGNQSVHSHKHDAARAVHALKSAPSHCDFP